ncbi:hypothetical protein E2562_029277 [Oryza meyeriana var. granulata]|uniref:GH18 domain-containing protein n=1 Tax=Oryza meyeriana var. granulata TaxID=110450 RepID=A0A6G1BQD2_9ORYZ|nr:hypothetical protein E2562_029277 [Oryza meyeriana var. granulata]
MAVASKRPAASLLALAALLAVVGGFLAGPAAATGKTGQVTVFWGRNKAEGSLREACDTGTYTIVVISFLNVFGHGKPSLDLSGHPIAGIGDDIKHCQSRSILVFLSIGGFGHQYSLPSAKAATDLADYLWYAYLAGSRKGVYRPFGDAYVDGIDFFIDQGSPEYYDVLATRLWSYNKQFRARTPVQLSATPRCRYPDRRVERALATGLVTRIHVRFYDDGYCAAYWQQEWEKWTAAYPNSGIYVGLPASEQTVGYVHPKNLYYGVIPVVQKAPNYGGVMIWDRYADRRTNYSSYAIQWA